MTNYPLYESGIQTEQSDIRAHVSVVCKKVYVFKTQNALDAIRITNPESRSAYQDGVDGATAQGWLVRPRDIVGLRTLPCGLWGRWDEFNEGMTTSEKGLLAVDLVVRILSIGYFPIWIEASENQCRNVQINGTDIIVNPNVKIQVKCDYRAGEYPGTGNLFLQFAERNPLKRH